MRICREYVERAGGVLDDRAIYADHGESGASIARSQFETLIRLATARPPLVDVIVTEDVSRLSRDFADAAQLFKQLQFSGVPLLGVADGVDTSAKHGKVTFAVKSLVADLYLDDLRYKTLRGMEGQALKGFSTGNLPYGYRSSAVLAADGKIAGYKIEIDVEKAKIVVRIFHDYLAGRSLSGIATALNREGVEPPRARTRHRRKGWVDSTVRAMLHNSKYAGIWTFKERIWAKVPGTNRRLPRKRDASEVIRRERPELRLIDEEVWGAAAERLAQVHAHYTRSADGKPKGRAAPGKATYLFSGLLFCQRCEAPMVIYGGGTGSRQYRCIDAVKRGTCQNRLGVREEIARTRILEQLRDVLLSPASIAYVRKRAAERLGEMARTQGSEIEERRARLARTESRIANLIGHMADGDRSEYLDTAFRDLEAQARTEKAAIAELARRTEQPIHLPTPEEIVQRVFDLQRRLAEDTVAGREALRRLFKDGQIRLDPLPEGVYVARTELLPLVLLAEKDYRRPGVTSEAPVYCQGSGGKI